MSEPAASGTLTVPFGSTTAAWMALSRTAAGSFGSWSLQPVAPLPLHPATHALHYGSSCFEGLKAHRGRDGVVRAFRLADHVRRLQASAAALCLPVPDAETVGSMIAATVQANLSEVPSTPGALYVRPTLIGVDANLGAAAAPSTEALLFVIASPVGSYFDEDRPLTLRVETRLPRSTPQFGMVKAGANYAMALGVTQRALAEDDADQVLFAPDGDVQETGASNFILVDDRRVVTKALDSSFLHGITRDAVLTVAAHLGYHVEERSIAVDELVAWAEGGEAALVGTAVVMAGVGRLVIDGRTVRVGDGQTGEHTRRLRKHLVAIQSGAHEDRWRWTTHIPAAPSPTSEAGR